MTDFGEIRIEQVQEQPWVLYQVVTGHGSQLSIYFRHDKNFIHPETNAVICRGGDMRVTGFSESRQVSVDFWGLGFEPEIHANVAVAILGKRTDGTHLLAEELIIEIIEKTLLTNPNPEE